MRSSFTSWVAAGESYGFKAIKPGKEPGRHDVIWCFQGWMWGKSIWKWWFGTQKKHTPWKINLEPKNHLQLKRNIIFHPPPCLGCVGFSEIPWKFSGQIEVSSWSKKDLHPKRPQWGRPETRITSGPFMFQINWSITWSKILKSLKKSAIITEICVFFVWS